MQRILFWSGMCLTAFLLLACIGGRSQSYSRLKQDAHSEKRLQGAFVPSWRIPLKIQDAPYDVGLVSRDWDGDGTPDILVRTRSGVVVLDARGKKHAAFSVSEQTEFLALGQTQQGPLLLGFKTWGNAIEAYDRQGKHRWRYAEETAGIDWVAAMDIHDPKGDAIAVGYNGGVILLLDAAGQVIWRKETDFNAWSVAGARLSKGAPASFVSIAEGIILYDTQGKLIREIKPCYAGAVYGADLDGDGIDEILGLGNTVASGGYLWVYDANGKLRWRRKAATQYATLESPFAVGRFRGKEMEVAIGHSDGTVFLFGKQGALLPGLKVTPDLRAICTLKQSQGQDALLALTSKELICYTWQDNQVANSPVLPAQDVMAKDLPESPFVRAVQRNDVKQATGLLQKGSSPNGKNSQGSPVLIVAAHRGHLAMVRLLLEKGADIDACRKDGLSALMVAVSDGHSEVAQLLTQKGAKVNTVYTTQGLEVTALTLAVIGEKHSIVEALLKAGANPNLPDATPMKRTPLFWTDKVEIAQLLIASGAMVDARDFIGQTPLMSAVIEDNVEMVRFLISKGANINAREDKIRRLHFAATFTGDKELLKKIEQSGRLKERHEDGSSILEIALAQSKRTKTLTIIEMLRKAGAK